VTKILPRFIINEEEPALWIGVLVDISIGHYKGVSKKGLSAYIDKFISV